MSVGGAHTLRVLLDANLDVDGLQVRAADLETAFLALTETDQKEAA
ncbi:MAG: hypothetical protein U5R46_00040 [Gammaproteobacteria bacterium]|nr:hypothetical protein [Gammaproteobacteria bacterium]